ncbi:shikimate dehydrogenase family protein [Ancylobacter mangrovi]|uniref:shikimate dehydrogenase family protein n=1 Tax=Ancylobacter mangrovi TaxID=2972472 RepID=UPI00216217E6|nr:hypothetical protein [Ancylobacter mangrovi]MCS0503349.1 hypothetical protein [Ancylobacter mangrovi]
MSDAGAALLSITGETRLYFVIGDPIRQVRSTQLYNKIAAEKGIDVVFAPLQFAANDFDAAVRGLRSFKNLAGIIPTIPHKPRMMEVVDRIEPRAKLVGAVNSIRVEVDGTWVGDTFDGVGYVNGLESSGHNPGGRSVLLIGAGGAGAAIAVALADASVSRLRVVDVDAGKAERVVAAVKSAYPAIEVDTGAPVPAEFDIVANATPLGMAAGDPYPIDPATLVPGQIVTDMIMKPPVTPLLQAAEAKGCPIQVGYQALVGQAEANFNFFGLA